MKWFQNFYLVAVAALALGLCGVLWNVGRLTDEMFIGILAVALTGSLCTGQYLLSRLEQSGRDTDQMRRDAAHLKSQLKKLKTQAHYDHLTGLGNRNLLADRFQFVVERSLRSQATFALLMVDLNNFKMVNDNYGHTAGDEVLIASARRLVAAVRASDTVIRMGGDEFLLIIERFGKGKDLCTLGQKLIDSLSEDIALSSGEIVSVGASVGIAQFPEDGFDIGGLIEIADQSMYECKTSGRMPLEFA